MIKKVFLFLIIKNSSFTVVQSTPSSNIHSTDKSTEVASETQMKISTFSSKSSSDRLSSESIDTTYQSTSSLLSTLKTIDISATEVTSASLVSKEQLSTAKSGSRIILPVLDPIVALDLWHVSQ